MVVLNGLVDIGNTVVIVEHNLDVIKTADWVVDLGPDAGNKGGWIIAQGTPEQIVEQAQDLIETPKFIDPANTIPWRSWTGELLAPILKGKKQAKREGLNLKDIKAEAKKNKQGVSSTLGKQMPWLEDGKSWHLSQKSLKGKKAKWTPKMLETLTNLMADKFEQILVWEHPSQIVTEQEDVEYIGRYDQYEFEERSIATIETNHPGYLKIEVILPELSDDVEYDDIEEYMQIPGSINIREVEGSMKISLEFTNLTQITSEGLEFLFDVCLYAPEDRM